MEPTPWEVALLKRLDRATLAAQQTTGSPSDGEPEIEVAVDDVDAVKALFAGFKSRAASVHSKG